MISLLDAASSEAHGSCADRLSPDSGGGGLLTGGAVHDTSTSTNVRYLGDRLQAASCALQVQGVGIEDRRTCSPSFMPQHARTANQWVLEHAGHDLRPPGVGAELRERRGEASKSDGADDS